MMPLVENLKTKFGPAFSKLRANLDRLWDKFHTLSLRERRLAIASFLTLLLIVVKMAVLEPLERSIVLLDNKIQAEEKRSLKQLRSISTKPKVDDAYVLLFQRLDAPNASDEEIRSGMLHDIESYARSENMNLSEVKPQISTDKGSYKEFTVRMQADGTLPKLVQFFIDLIRTRKLYYVESFRITPHPEDPEKIRANVTVGRAVFSNPNI